MSVQKPIKQNKNPSGTSACNGDSGGGMTFERGGRSYLRGVVSIGVPLETDPTVCNPKYYTVYSDVSKYLEWIAQNVDGVNVIEPRIQSRW
jgi:secreted trypsin-like serine protease